MRRRFNNLWRTWNGSIYKRSEETLLMIESETLLTTEKGS